MSHIQVLRPYNPDQVMTSQEVAKLAHVHEKTARTWGRRFHLGRMIAGKMPFDRVAVHLYLEGQEDLLGKYLLGERELPAIRNIYNTMGLSAPAVNIAAE